MYSEAINWIITFSNSSNTELFIPERKERGNNIEVKEKKGSKEENKEKDLNRIITTSNNSITTELFKPEVESEGTTK